MKNKSIKIFICCFFCFGSLFATYKTCMHIIEPIAVHADDSSVGTQIKQRWYEFLAVAAAAGLTFSVQWTASNIQKLVDLYTATNTLNNMGDATANSKVQGQDLIISNIVASNAVKFWDWVKTNWTDKVSGLFNKIDLTGDDSEATGGSYTYLTNLSFYRRSSTSLQTFTSNIPVRAVASKLSDTSEIVSIYFFSDKVFTSNYWVYQDPRLNNVYYTFTADDTYLPATSNIPVIVWDSADSVSVRRQCYKYCYGDSVINPTIPNVSIGVVDSGKLDNYADIDKTGYNVLLPGLAKNISSSDVASDGTVSIDVSNNAIEKKIADDVIATPIDTTNTATYPLSDTVDVSKPVTPTYNPPSVTEGSAYAVTGLQDVFPFCIPFDIYYLISGLNASPVTPGGDFNIYVPGVVDYKSHLDLSAFNGVAETFRGAELVAFILGLLFATRKLIRG